MLRVKNPLKKIVILLLKRQTKNTAAPDMINGDYKKFCLVIYYLKHDENITYGSLTNIFYKKL